MVITTVTAPIGAIGNETLDLAYVAQGSNSCNQVYVLIYTAGSTTTPTAVAIASCPANAPVEVSSSVHGITTSGKATWATITVVVNNTNGVKAGATQFLCGPNTNDATTIYCAYKTGVSPSVLILNTITVSSGADGSASTIATDVTTYPTTTYTPVAY